MLKTKKKWGNKSKKAVYFKGHFPINMKRKTLSSTRPHDNLVSIRTGHIQQESQHGIKLIEK